MSNSVIPRIPRSIRSVAVIGLGSFGRFIADEIANRLPDSVDVVGHDPVVVNGGIGRVRRVDLVTAALCDVVILAVPLSEYDRLLPRLSPLIDRGTLLIDVCSVKVRPQELFSRHLPGHTSLLLTHPLFGPLAAAKGLAEPTLVVTHSEGSLARQVLALCQSSGLRVVIQDADEHDARMARVQALTFFVARSLENMQLSKGEALETPSYKMLLDLVNFAEANSDAIFDTIQNGNSHSTEIRKALMNSFREVEAELLGDVPDGVLPYSSSF